VGGSGEGKENCKEGADGGTGQLSVRVPRLPGRTGEQFNLFGGQKRDQGKCADSSPFSFNMGRVGRRPLCKAARKVALWLVMCASGAWVP